MIALIALSVIALIVVNQESILYIPVVQNFKTPGDNPTGYQSPDQLGLSFEDVRLRTADGANIHGWFIPAGDASRNSPTIVFCHENAGNIGLRLPEFHAQHRYLNVNQLVFDYRGYGYSSGTPSEEGMIEDTFTMLRWLSGKVEAGELDGSSIILDGRSLGGAVSIHVAAAIGKLEKKLSYPPAAMIIENSFTSISDMVDAKFPFLNVPYFKDFFLRLHWRSIDKIPSVTIPLLFMSSIHDEIVPPSQMKMLYESAKGAKEKKFVSFLATHNDISKEGGAHVNPGERYWKAKSDFVRNYFSEPN
mmetsp:Transcript_32505/g.43982  ORF Transcript_32505/g.43982 Transcript_32505/m.43982 type:complete len:304 (-) Transcript_32505:107-1018(-)